MRQRTILSFLFEQYILGTRNSQLYKGLTCKNVKSFVFLRLHFRTERKVEAQHLVGLVICFTCVTMPLYPEYLWVSTDSSFCQAQSRSGEGREGPESGLSQVNVTFNPINP